MGANDLLLIVVGTFFFGFTLGLLMSQWIIRPYL